MLRGRGAQQVTAESKHRLSLLPHALGFDHELASVTVFGGRDMDRFLPPSSPLKHMKGNKVQQRPQGHSGATLEKGPVPWGPLIPITIQVLSIAVDVIEVTRVHQAIVPDPGEAIHVAIAGLSRSLDGIPGGGG